MKINEVIGEWIIMPQSIKPLGLIRKSGGGFDFKNKGNNRANEQDFYGGDNAFADKEGNKFNVKAVNDFVAKNKGKYLKRNFPISKIAHNRKYWQKDKARMMNTDTRHPLLVLKEPDGNLSVADGLNRLEKAIRVEKKTAVDVYFVPKADIMHLAQPSEVKEKAPPGREKQVKALKGKVDNPYAVAWASYNKSKDKKEDVDQFAPARALGEAQSSLMHGLQMAQNIIKKDYKLAEVQAKVIAENWPPLIDKIQNIYKKEDAAGVGIITKQNTTQDVKPGDEYKNVKKLGL